MEPRRRHMVTGAFFVCVMIGLLSLGSLTHSEYSSTCQQGLFYTCSDEESDGLYAQYKLSVMNYVDQLGTALTDTVTSEPVRSVAPASSDSSVFNEVHEHRSVSVASLGSALFTSGWSDGSVYVDSSGSMYPSRPSAFGPHIVGEPVSSVLFPIEYVSASGSHGCEDEDGEGEHQVISAPTASTHNKTHWTALVERGNCTFSQKVRYAMRHGASAVIFGDASPKAGGLAVPGALLTPWSPDDTHDVTIPSTFVSRDSYLALVESWKVLQPEAGPWVGLGIVLEQNDAYSWPVLDLILLLLFLPSLITFASVIVQRIRQSRQRKRDRAPREVVDKLPVFVWGPSAPKPVEKPAGAATTGDGDGPVAEGGGAPPEGAASLAEENDPDADNATHDTPTESTLLLHPEPAAPRSRLLTAWDATRKALRRAPADDLERNLSPRPIAMPTEPHKSRWNSNECAICLEEFADGNIVMELPCGHLFHRVEIEGWLIESKRICPVCRCSITSPGLPATETGSNELEASSSRTNV